MRMISGVILAVLLLIGGGAYYFLSDNSLTLRFSENDLRERLDRQLPFSKNYLLVFNVTLDNPRIDLIDGSDRIAGGVDAILNVKFGGSETPVGGALDISGGVRYEAAAGEFFLTDPIIENVHIQGIPSSIANRANKALSLALEEFYRDRPIYRLSETELNEQAARLILRDVVVEDETLVVTLGLKDNEADTEPRDQ